jgi:hypothetical protein
MADIFQIDRSVAHDRFGNLDVGRLWFRRFGFAAGRKEKKKENTNAFYHREQRGN